MMFLVRGLSYLGKRLIYFQAVLLEKEKGIKDKASFMYRKGQ